MSRAEYEANIKYGGELVMTPRWHGFIEGYEQAEKHFTLTWEDIKIINQMLSAVEDEDPDDEYFELSDEQFYQEVLKRFNEWKQEHSDKN